MDGRATEQRGKKGLASWPSSTATAAGDYGARRFSSSSPSTVATVHSNPLPRLSSSTSIVAYTAVTLFSAAVERHPCHMDTMNQTKIRCTVVGKQRGQRRRCAPAQWRLSPGAPAPTVGETEVPGIKGDGPLGSALI